MKSTRPINPDSVKSKDNKNKHFSLTAFQEPALTILRTGPLPPWVEMKAGGLEECPETKRIHFQGMIKTKYPVRLSKVINAFKGAHVEIARNPNALLEYVLKADTAIDDKQIVEYKADPITYDVIVILRKMASMYIDMLVPHAISLLEQKQYIWYLDLMEDYGYSYLTSTLLIGDDRYAYILLNPRLKTYWREHGHAHIARV